MMVFMVACDNSGGPKNSEEGLCSYIVRDSLLAWMDAKGMRPAVQGDTLRISFNRHQPQELWGPKFTDSAAVQTMAALCGSRWRRTGASEGYPTYELQVMLQTSDSTYKVPNNLVLYLFKQP